MSDILRALVVEDNEDDYLLLTLELQRGGFLVESIRVENEPHMRRVLAERRWDAILSDYKMPTFSGIAALGVAREVAGDIPFVLVSGTVGEELAVEAMLAGADDYLMKGHLSRLCAAIRRELREAALRKAARDTAEREQQSIRALERQSAYNRLRAELWRVASDRTAEEPQLIAELLRLTGQSLGVSRVSYNTAGQQERGPDEFVCIQEWCAPGISSTLGTSMPRALALALVRGDSALLLDMSTVVEELPVALRPLAAPVVDAFRRVHDIDRIVACRYIVRNRLRGVITLDICTSQPVKPIVDDETLSIVRELCAIVASMTAAAEAQREREETQEQLLHSQKLEAIGQLAGGVAHDFNNLLTAIQGYASLLLGRLTTGAPMQAELRQIHAAAVRAGALTRQLLLFSRREPLARAPVNVNATIESMLKMLRRLIGENIEVHTGLALADVTVLADESGLEQVIMNLTVNARDAMPHGGSLMITTDVVTITEGRDREHPQRPAGRYVRIDFADSGLGMDDGVKARIFEPFFTTKEAGKGTGLGLSVVYGIVRQLDGWIEVESAPGKGAIFSLFVPHSGQCVVSAPTPSQTVSPAGSGQRILVVEDDETVRELAAAVLGDAGYEVITCDSAERATERLAASGEHFHLVISDVIMPGISGVDLAEDLIHRSPPVRVLLVSGYTDERTQLPRIQAMKLPFLRKPYSVDSLLTSVNQVLERN